DMTQPDTTAKTIATILLLAAGAVTASGQSGKDGLIKTKTDSSFIVSFQRKNDFRITYGTKSATLTFGSTRKQGSSGNNLYSNVNDFLGVGLTYKFVDFDLLFSLPQTRL